MKKEVSGKKSKWLWLVLGLVVLLAIVGVVLAFVLGGGNDKATVGGRPNLYWNVDKKDNVDPDTGLSIREPAEDGNYYIRFAYDGEQVEIPVADKKLVNYIDSLDLMSLTLDENGFVVDIFLPKDVATVVGEGMYVQSVDANNINVNSAVAMNGRKIEIKLSEDLAIYNVSGTGEFVGEAIDADELNAMDSVSIYGTLVPEGSDEEVVITHIFVTKKPVESPVYWRADKFYKKKKTTRVPDENGEYTIPFYCEGERFEFKCKDVALVTKIDSVKRELAHFGLEFDEDGYIVGTVSSFLGSRTLLQCERFDITSISEDGSYTATSIIKNNGATVEGVLGEDCVIYDVSPAAEGEHQLNRRVDSLQLGDRVCIWTDTLGNPVLVYISTRLVDSPAYWNVSREYNSTTKTTKREPNANGYYEVELLKAGDTKKQTYYLKTLEDATYLDANTDRCVGLKVGEGNVIEYVYNMSCIFGNSYFCRGYFVTDASAAVCTFQSNAGSGYTISGVLSPDCKIWNVSTYGKYGEETTLQIGDSAYTCKSPTGEIISAYVTRRALGADHMYWRLSSQKYDSTNKVTTRTPDEEGYYVYKFAHMGKEVVLKTKDKEHANYIDSLSTAALAMVVKGDIIQSVHNSYYAVGGIKRSGWYVKSFTDSAITMYTSAGKEETWFFAEDVQIYNVGRSFKEFKGEKTKLQVNDYIYLFFDVYSNVAIIYVTGRDTSNIAWPVAPQYDSTNSDTLRVPDADGWYYVDLVVNGQIKTYKTKNKAIMKGVDSYNTAFGIETSGDVITYYSTVGYVENLKGVDVSNYTVTSISGKNITTMATLGAPTTVGKTKSFTLTSSTKIYDVSGSAGKMGETTKLQVGDKIYTYKDNDGNTQYVFVAARGNRAGGYMSLCDHCNEVVYWNPYHAGTNVTTYDCHYYLASDLTIFAQMRVYSNDRDFETVLDLNGHTLTRDSGRAVLVRYGDTLTVIDSVGGGKIETTGDCGNGTVINVSRGTLNLYGGTLSHINGEDPADWSYAGGLLLCTNATVNMYGGTLANGEVFADKSHEAYGGAARVTTSTFNMYGGLITGGKAHDFTYTTSTGTEKTKSAHGGNIFAEKESVVNIFGGTIENGEADDRGGNIYVVTKSTVNITGGKIVGGVVHDRGGNIFNSSSTVNISGGEVVDGLTTSRMGGNIMSTGQTGFVNISGGKITGGTGTSDNNPAGGNICLMYSNVLVTGGEISGGNSSIGANIAAYESSGKGSSVTITGGVLKGAENSVYVSSALSGVTITGGTLEGLTNINRIGNFTISGKPVIKNLKLGETVLLTLDKMEQGADVTVNKTGVFTKPDAAAYAQYFKAYDSELLIGTTADGALKVYHPDSAAGYCPHCESEAEWMPWDGVKVDPGHYFLEEDLALEGRVKINSGTNVILDLQGKTVTAKTDSRAFYVSGNLSVIDSVGGGSITGGRAVDNRGGNIYVDGGTFNLYSGAITDGVSDGGYGGNVYATNKGTINIKGGTISGGSGKYGDNVYAMYSELNISGGEIIGSGTGSVPSVAAKGSGEKLAYVNISGGKLTGSVNNLSVANSLVEVSISGGELDGLSVISKVAKLDVSGKPVIENLQLGEDTVMTVGEMADGASIVINKVGTFTSAFASKAAAEEMLNSGFFAPYNVGESLGVTEAFELEVIGRPSNTISQMCEECGQTVEFTAWYGNDINENGHYYAHDNIALENRISIKAGIDVVLDLQGKTVTAATDNRAFYVSGTLSIIDSVGGGSITGGRSVDDRGGNIYVSSGGTFNLYSGAITNGYSKAGYGGNVYASGGVINIKGGTISGGEGKYGDNVYAMYSELNISGGEIIGDDTASIPNVGAKGASTSEKKAIVNITGGKIYGSATNLAISYSKTEVYISGGELDGLFTITKAKLYLSGNPVIESLQLSDTTIQGVGVMEDGASIKIDATSGEFTEVLSNAADVVGYFDAVDSAYNVAVSADNKLEIVVDPEGGNPGGGEGGDATPGSCPHCEGALWTEWDGSTVTSGHYYLTAQKDITGAQLEVVKDTDVVIDLRGNTINATDVRAFRVQGQLSIVDTVGGGKVIGTGVANNDSANGGLFYVSGGGILNLYSGELSMADENHGAMRGGVILVSSNSTFNMYGGAVRNGVADGDSSADSSLDRYGRGGNICNQGGILNLEGGVIDGGKAGNGGNIYNGAYESATTNISGTVVISNGTAVNGNGGNLYVERGTLNISGGTMTGGKASDIGDNILMTHSTKADLTITGGVLEGVTRLGTLSKFALSGNPVIENLQLAQNTVIAELGTLTEGASIGVSKVNTTNLAFTDVLDNAADVVGFFKAADADKIVLVAENKLTLGEACPCGCKTPIEDVQWLDANAYMQTLSQKTENNGVIIENVHLRLSDDLDITALYNDTKKQISIGGENADVNVVIDLNGKTWSSNHRIYNNEGCTLTILDSSAEGTGVMTSTGSSATAHGGVFANYGTLNIYSGTFTQPAGGSKVSKGGIVYQSKGVFNLYGGTLKGGQTVVGTNNAALGGNVHIYAGTFNMYGGTISGGIAQSDDPNDQGGNVYIRRKDATFNMYGGTITGGTADQGSDVFLGVSTTAGSVLNMAGGEIAGQVYVPNALSVVNVSGAAVIGNLTLMTEDAIVSVGDLFSTALIAVNKTTEFTDVLFNAERYLPNFTGVGETGTVAVTAEGKLIVTTGCPCGCGKPVDDVEWKDLNPLLELMDTDLDTDGIQMDATFPIDEDVHYYLSADIAVNNLDKNQVIRVGSNETRAKATIDLRGFTLSADRRTYIYEGSTLTVMDSSDGETGVWSSTGKKSTSVRGRVMFVEGTLKLLSGTIMMSENTVELASGSVIHNADGGVFYMYGGKVLNGRSDGVEAKGGNVAVTGGAAFYMYGGEIADGEAAIGSNVYVAKAGTFVQEGGTIEDAENTVYKAS